MVDRAFGVEYSPLAQFVGATKLAYRDMEIEAAAEAVKNLLRFVRSNSAELPALSAFSNPSIFDRDLCWT